MKSQAGDIHLLGSRRAIEIVENEPQPNRILEEQFRSVAGLCKSSQCLGAERPDHGLRCKAIHDTMSTYACHSEEGRRGRRPPTRCRARSCLRGNASVIGLYRRKLPRRPDTIVGLQMMILLNASYLGSKRGLLRPPSPTPATDH